MSTIIGNRIYNNIERPDPALVEKFRGLPSSNINDMMNRLYCMRGNIKRRGQLDTWLLGTAVTAKVPDGDNVFVHRALDVAQPGDVVVVDGNGCTSRSLMGEIMFTYAQNKGIAGIIVDGAIRDMEALYHLDIPVYAAAVTPQGPYKNGPGEINVPVSCGGQVVFPGDILVGDADGVVVVRKEFAEEILQLALDKKASEDATLERYRTIGNNTEKHFANYDAVIQRIGTAIL